MVMVRDPGVGVHVAAVSVGLVLLLNEDGLNATSTAAMMSSTHRMGRVEVLRMSTSAWVSIKLGHGSTPAYRIGQRHSDGAHTTSNGARQFPGEIPHRLGRTLAQRGCRVP